MFQARVNDCIFLNIYDEQDLKRTKNRVLQNRLIEFVLIKTLSNSKLFFLQCFFQNMLFFIFHASI